MKLSEKYNIEKFGDLIFSILFVIMFMMLGQSLLGQCLQLAFIEDNDCIKDCSQASVIVNPSVPYQIVANEIWLEARPHVDYSIHIVYQCDEPNTVCMAKDYGRYFYTGECCDDVRNDTIDICHDSSFASIVYGFENGCPVETHIWYVGLPSSIGYDTIHLCSGEELTIPMEVHSNVHGCDSTVYLTGIKHKSITHKLDDGYGLSADTIITPYTDQWGCDSFTLQIIRKVSDVQMDGIEMEMMDSTEEPIIETPNIEIIELDNGDWYGVPDAFSPNNDGINDVFEFFSRDRDFIMRIYNRWGIQIYRDVIFWDGRFRGEYVQQDTYAYSIEYNGNIVKGFLTVQK